MADVTPGMICTDLLRNGKPKALAWVRGNAQNPRLSGLVKFYDKRFTIPAVMGRSVIIHRMPDDFMTQPSGNSGEKIGCGVITVI